MSSFYEKHNHKNPSFPFIFHEDERKKEEVDFLHWHQALEIIYVTMGIVGVQLDTTMVLGYPGDAIIINSNTAHRVNCISDTCNYKCYIIDLDYSKKIGVDVESTILQSRIHDSAISNVIERIFIELNNKVCYYEELVKALTTELLITVFRKYMVSTKENTGNLAGGKVQIAKDTITYIHKYYNKPITVDDISEAIGFSKYYLSRIFKEISRSTMVEYINGLRCEHARKLLRAGESNVSESAQACGFNNLSYFTRTYKSIYGILPSEEVKEMEVIV